MAVNPVLRGCGFFCLFEIRYLVNLSFEQDSCTFRLHFSHLKWWNSLRIIWRDFGKYEGAYTYNELWDLTGTTVYETRGVNGKTIQYGMECRYPMDTKKRIALLFGAICLLGLLGGIYLYNYRDVQNTAMYTFEAKLIKKEDNSYIVEALNDSVNIHKNEEICIRFLREYDELTALCEEGDKLQIRYSNVDESTTPPTITISYAQLYVKVIN